MRLFCRHGLVVVHHKPQQCYLFSTLACKQTVATEYGVVTQQVKYNSPLKTIKVNL